INVPPFTIADPDTVVDRLPDGAVKLLAATEFGLLLFLPRDVACNRRDPERPPLRVPDQRDREGNINRTAVLVEAPRLEVREMLAPAHPRQNRVLLVREFGRNDVEEEPAHHLE